MSSRHTRSLFGILLVMVFALSAIVVAPASAKLTKHQKAHIRHQLMRSIKKHPKLIRSKHFIKKASLVNFQLPVTIRLRGATNDKPFGPLQTAPVSSTTNPNSARINLGASLGTRQISLGGSLPAVIGFHDSYDGGALGNVDLTLKPGGALTTTSIPLLWNSQVSDPTTTWDSGLFGDPTPGCGDFTGNADLANGLAVGATGFPWFSVAGPGGAPNVPVRAANYLNSIVANPANPLLWDNSQFDNGGLSGNIAEKPGVDGINNLAASMTPGDPNNVGGQTDPFPTGQQPTSGIPSFKDSVLRTGPLSLAVATPGPQTAAVNPGDGPVGTQTINVGPSGGQANLFGPIPGKGYGIDVTVSLQTEIASILREVDADALPLLQGQPWPGATFQCRQAWTGYVHNVLAGIRLKGNLKIAPAITKDGKLRIAKATLNQLDPNSPTQIALAACLAPYDTFAKNQGNSGLASTVNNTSLPVDETTQNYPAAFDAGGNLTSAAGPATSVRCDDTPTALVRGAKFKGIANSPSYGTGVNGSAVSVAGGLTVDSIAADVIIGDPANYNP